MNKSGMYYILDAILAGLLITGVIILLLSVSNDSVYTSPEYLSQDLLNALSTIKVSEIDETLLLTSISEVDHLDFEASVLEQMGKFWALNLPDDARNLAVLVLSSFNSSKEVILKIGGDEIYSFGSAGTGDVFLSRKMIAGIDKGKPLTGTSASAYLKKIRDKKTSSYSYFGGFTGQGNITKKLILPNDYNKLLEVELKIETPGNFKIFINDDACGDVRLGFEGVVLIYDLISCNASFIPGVNLVKLDFSSVIIDDAFISGGYIKATYTTDVLQESVTQGVSRYYFPGIDGLINVYDSISVQGNITKVDTHLYFYNEYGTFFTIGDQRVMYEDGINESRYIFEPLNYVPVDPVFSSIVPIRLGVTNLSNVTTVLDGLPADVFLVTDVSGSMSNCGIHSEPLTCRYSCVWGGSKSCVVGAPSNCVSGSKVCGGTCFWDSNYRLDCDATLMDVAKDAAKVFVDEVLNESVLHKIGLVKFSTSATLDSSLTNHANTLKSIVDTYSAGGGTCTCCGINRARNTIMSSEKERFIVILSDGVPTFYCDSFSDYAGSGTRGDSTGTVMNDADENWAIDAAQLACNNNITVYSIGFGEAITSTGHDVLSQLACNESLYFSTADMDELAEIFRNISSQILLVANYSSQTILIEGDFVYSNLSADSYLDIFFDPFIESEDVGKIELTFESDPFGCNASIFIPHNLEVLDAKIASFSGNTWTKKLRITNNDVDELIYDIDLFNKEYSLLGDPFQIQIPHTLIRSGQINNFSLELGDSPSNISDCSMSNTLIYTGFINASTPRTDSLEFAEGCFWFVETLEGSILELAIPEDHIGNYCYYNSSSVPFNESNTYNKTDAYDVAMFNLLSQLDPDGSGRIIVDLDESDLEIHLTLVGSIPYMWGPSIAEIEVRT